jgi:tRNA-specific 2-thiouridylase
MAVEVMARIRYRQPLQKLLYINLKTECTFLSRTTISYYRRQFVAWYIEDELVGSGVIS